MINNLIKIAEEAGKQILFIYQQSSFGIQTKLDASALTDADIKSHHYIIDALTKLYPTIPIISEEASKQCDYPIRKTWEYFFLVDPLDGTKEFIKKNNEFTVNIALIRHTKPIMGVIHAPALGITYYAELNNGAYKINQNKITKLNSRSTPSQFLRVIVSRSHCNEQTTNYLNSLREKHGEFKTVMVGSALKFGLLAEGNADIYPRFAPTKEWDTAAGQIIVNETGKQVINVEDNQPLQYNKKSLLNPFFIVS